MPHREHDAKYVQTEVDLLLMHENKHACGRVAKLAGDKRADVAEKGFGRPFRRVVIAQSGLR